MSNGHHRRNRRSDVYHFMPSLVRRGATRGRVGTGENVVDEHSSADIKASNWVFWVVLLGSGLLWFCLVDVVLAPWLTSEWDMPDYVVELVTGVGACGVLFAALSLASRLERR